MNANTTVNQWLEEWYRTYAMPNIKHSTAISYECYIRKHISPALGDMKMQDIDLGVLQMFFNDIKQTLSPKTISNIRMMLHAAFRYACLYDLISKNYIEYVIIPPVRKQNIRVFTRAEQQQLICTLQSSPEKSAFGVFLCLTTGIRVGELCALQWQDIDLDSGILHISKTAQRLMKLNYNGNGNKTEIVIGEPKSQASRRDIPMGKPLVDAFLLYKHRKEKECGKAFLSPTAFILSNKRRTPIEPRTMQDVFHRILAAAKIANASFHTLRHTFATRALEAGVDFKTLSVLLGHADIYVTMNRYAHVLDEQKRNAMHEIMLTMFH